MTDIQLTLYLNGLFAVVITLMLAVVFVALVGIGVSTAYDWLQKVKRNKK